MGFLYVSYDYPSIEQRKDYIQEFGPDKLDSVKKYGHFTLSVSATDEQWKQVVTWIQQVHIESNPAAKTFWQTTQLRPLRPNDDNYIYFSGEMWRPPMLDPRESSDPDIQNPNGAFQLWSRFHKTNDPIPHYHYCVVCKTHESQVKPRLLACSRCKIVKYCSKECQINHWKKFVTHFDSDNTFDGHKRSCVPAQERTLWQVVHNNDGFFIAPEECKEIARQLRAAPSSSLSSSLSGVELDELRRQFAIFFDHTSRLGGCFAL